MSCLDPSAAKPWRITPIRFLTLLLSRGYLRLIASILIYGPPRQRPHVPRSGIDASRRGPDEDIPRGRDQTKNAVAATSRDRNPASGALIQDRIAITDAERGDMLARAPPHENGRSRTRRTRVLPVQLTGHQ